MLPIQHSPAPWNYLVAPAAGADVGDTIPFSQHRQPSADCVYQPKFSTVDMETRRCTLRHNPAYGNSGSDCSRKGRAIVWCYKHYNSGPDWMRLVIHDKISCCFSTTNGSWCGRFSISRRDVANGKRSDFSNRFSHAEGRSAVCGEVKMYKVSR